MKKEELVQIDNMPTHVAFIMDGNGRWAKKRGLPREFGHKQGASTFKKVVRHCFEVGVKYVTVYAFSTENWKRPEHEVKAIMGLLNDYLDACFKEMKQDNLQVHFIGDMAALPLEMQAKIRQVEFESKDYQNVLNVALNYGSRDEIIHAIKKLHLKGIDNPSEEDIKQCLYTAHCPDPDLIVRTGGEMRLSNYLLWQAAYAELYFTNVLWPDLTNEDIDEALRCFSNRSRRFGGI